MTVSVLVPWRQTDTDRAAAWAYVRSWWANRAPDWEVVTGTCPDGPWVKALAVADALTRATGDTLVVADADVLVPGAGIAAGQVTNGARWVIPHTRVLRLGRDASQLVYATGTLPTVDPQRRHGVPTGVYASYKGVEGGGCVVLSRAMYERVPLDPRFAGWGHEDQSWARALEVIAGPAWRGTEHLWHLWHPPQDRLTRAIGSPEGAALFRRYRATGTAAAMTALLDEFRTVAVAPTGDSTR